MAKKIKQSKDNQQRQSRKDVLLARRHERQSRQIWLAFGGVIALLVVVLLIGVVNELFLKPNQPVATVDGVEIPMRDWQDRVRFQRAQLIIGIEDLAEVVGQDIGQVQQFAGQQMNLLLDPETLGQLVLDQVIDEKLILQGAEERGISVSDAEVQKEIEAGFAYFDGAAPTSTPVPSETPIPTPSLTPIPTAVITEVVPTNTPFPTPPSGPTNTPAPAPTAVSQEAFEQMFGDSIDELRGMASNEETLRSVVRARLLQDMLMDALAEEEGLEDEEEQATFFYIGYEDEAEAIEAQGLISESDYLTVWNSIRSRSPEEVQASTIVASEAIWRTQDNVMETFGPEVAEIAFDLDEGEPSLVIVQVNESEEGTDRYFIILVNGREVRPLDDATLQNLKREILGTWLENQRQLGVLEIFERWRNSVPRRPLLDRRFLVPPTPAPATPTLGAPIPVETPAP